MKELIGYKGDGSLRVDGIALLQLQAAALGTPEDVSRREMMIDGRKVTVAIIWFGQLSTTPEMSYRGERGLEGQFKTRETYLAWVLYGDANGNPFLIPSDCCLN